MFFSQLLQRYKRGNLLVQIFVAMLLGIVLGGLWSEGAAYVAVLGKLFTGALKAIAPILIFILTLSSIAMGELESKVSRIRNVMLLYILATFLAALTAVSASFLFPTEIVLSNVDKITQNSPASVSEVLMNLLYKVVDNPIHALSSANFLSILMWAVAGGFALKSASKESKAVFADINEAILKVVGFVVKLAPFGIFGLVAQSVATTGAAGMLSYARLLCVLVGTMIFIALVINAIIVFVVTKKNPFPLIFICLRQSGLVAFFTRSSAANVPINMNLCKKLKIDKELYSITIPLGATVNMGGAAVTISVITLATAWSVGIDVSFLQAFLLSIVASFAACGASGVAGGSLLLIPLACSLFNINQDTAMQAVAVGFIIGVVQDSVETALNSSTDVLFTAIASHNELDLELKGD